MNFKTAQNLVENITYKPGTVIKLTDHCVLMILSSELNVNGCGHCDLKFDQSIPFEMLDNMNERAFLTFVYEMFVHKELHELDEWLKVKGKHVKVPVH